MDTQTIERLAEIMGQHGLTELEVEEQGIRIRLHRSGASAPGALPSSSVSVTAEAAGEAEKPVSDSEASLADVKDAKTVSVTSPLVGTYYASGSPDAEPFVREGSRVTAGMTVCIIEAMKVMNEVKAECSGVITKVLCQNKSMVEYGTVLFEMNVD